MKIQVFQNLVALHNADKINRDGFKSVEGVDEWHNCMMFGSEKYEPVMFKYYTHTRNVIVDDSVINPLETCFGVLNDYPGFEAVQVEYLTRSHSLSVGDILVKEDGSAFMVDSF